MITQGDQYYLPLTITAEDKTAITPDMVNGVLFQLGNVCFAYPNGGIEYNDGWNVWLSQDQTKQFKKTELAQMAIQFKTNPKDIQHTGIKRIPVQESIIKGSFNAN